MSRAETKAVCMCRVPPGHCLRLLLSSSWVGRQASKTETEEQQSRNTYLPAACAGGCASVVAHPGRKSTGSARMGSLEWFSSDRSRSSVLARFLIGIRCIPTNTTHPHPSSQEFPPASHSHTTDRLPLRRRGERRFEDEEEKRELRPLS